MNSIARTTLDLPAPLMREIKSRAALSGVSMKDFIAELLQKTLFEAPVGKPESTNVSLEPDWMMHVGTIKGSKSLAGDPVAIQRKMRGEWQRKNTS